MFVLIDIRLLFSLAGGRVVVWKVWEFWGLELRALGFRHQDSRLKAVAVQI